MLIVLLLLFLVFVPEPRFENGVSNVKIVGCGLSDDLEANPERCSSPKRLLAVELPRDKPAKLSREPDRDKPARFCLELDRDSPRPLVTKLLYD